LPVGKLLFSLSLWGRAGVGVNDIRRLSFPPHSPCQRERIFRTGTLIISSDFCSPLGSRAQFRKFGWARPGVMNKAGLVVIKEILKTSQN